jgi:hypothetical protein
MLQASLVAWNRWIVESRHRDWPLDFALVYIEEAHAKEGWSGPAATPSAASGGQPAGRKQHEPVRRL